MNSPTPSSLTESIAAAQQWWREAGVDYAFEDDAQRWIGDDEPEHAPPPVFTSTDVAAPVDLPPSIGGEPESWPRDLEAFRTWWLEEPSLDHGGTHPRVASRGNSGAPVMFLVPMPETLDSETLLSGPQGKLLASFATAMGIAPEDAFFASALPRHTPVPDWNSLDSQGLGRIIMHLVELAQPQRLIVMGTGILPLVGHDPAQGTPAIGQLAIQGRTLPLLASYAPGRLLDHPRLRASLWKRWLEWTDGEAR